MGANKPRGKCVTYMYTDIEDYAIIGNLKSACLVSKDGSIDWLPAPYISSGSVFAKILDDKIGGYWSIRPTGEYVVDQKYTAHTNILETLFETKTGTMCLTDFVPVEKDKEIHVPEDNAILEIYRKIECLDGECEIESIFEPRFDYGRSPMKLVSNEKGILIEGLIKTAVLITNLKHIISNNKAKTKIKLTKGQAEVFVFRFNTYNFFENYELNFELEYTYTKKFWENWISECDLGICNFTQFWEDQVIRSALLLKILFFEPTGAVAAAPTTSLPEKIGGIRNWDYRFSWIRDSSLTLDVLIDIGHIKEAEKYVRWLIKVCGKSVSNITEHPESIQIMYGLQGETDLQEEILSNLSGYKNSKPVRIGNGAFGQKQWDIYGSILDTIWKTSKFKTDTNLVSESWDTLRALTNYVVRIWREPDEGLWEVRGGKKNFTYSKAMCWVAIDRAIKLSKKYNLDADVHLWKKEKEIIKKEILDKSWNKKMKSFTQSFNDISLDSALLRLPAIGFIDGDDPKMISTIDAIEKELSCGHGLFYRYKTSDGLPGKEGAFLLASFWFIDALCLAGETEKAVTYFERVLEYANHVGLYSEELEVETGHFLGNFPQGYTHIGLINSAFNLNNLNKKSN